MAKLGMMHTLLRHVSHPLQQHHEDVLPRHNSPGKQNGASHMDESDRNLVNNQMFTSSGYHKNHPYDDDNDTYQASYLARELRVDKAGWDHFTKGKAGMPHPFTVLVTHALRNIVRPPPGGVTYEKVEEELYSERQERQRQKVKAKRPKRRQQCCGVRTVHPLSRTALIYNALVTVVDATYTAFIVPIGIAFQYDAKEFSWYNAIDIAAGTVYWIDIVMGFSTGFVVIYNLRRKVVTEPKLVAEYYMWHSTFFVDLLAALPLIAEVITLPVPGQTGGLTLHIVLLLRLFRMWRVVKFAEKMVFLSLIGRMNRTVMRFVSIGHIFFINVCYAALVFINLLGCLWLYIASLEGKENSWMTSVDNKSIVDSNGARQYVAAVYFVTLTITTVGYGDINPVTAVEELACMVLMMIGVIFFGFVISSSQRLVTYLSSEARKAGMLRGKLEQVELWTRRRHLSQTLTQRIRAYYAEVWLQYAEINDEMFFRELPAALRTDMALELARPIFSHSDVFECLDEEAERLLAARLTPMVVLAGHNVAQEGDEADALFLLQEGELLLLRHTKDVRLLSAPAIVGESALLSMLPDGGPHLRPVTLRAVSPCLLWALYKHDLEHIFEILPELKRKLVELMRRRMQRYLQRASDNERSHWKSMLQRASMLEDHVVHQAAGPGPSKREQEEDVIGSDAEPVRTSSGSGEGGDASGDGDDDDLSDVPRELREIELEEGEAHDLDGRIQRQFSDLRQQPPQEGAPDEREEGGAARASPRRKLGELTGANGGEKQDAAVTGSAGSSRGEAVAGAGAVDGEEGPPVRPGSGASGVDGVQGGGSQRLRRLRRGSAMLSSSGKSWGSGSKRGGRGQGPPRGRPSARQQQQQDDADWVDHADPT